MLLFWFASSQAQKSVDTLSLAKQLRSKGHYKQAAKVLGAYSVTHPKDVNTLWLYAQTEFWLGRMAKSKAIYVKAVALKPDNDYLQLDYAKTLANAGDWEQAGAVIMRLQAAGKNYTDGEFVQAQIAYWKGDYRRAEKELDDVLWRDGLNKSAAQLLDDVLQARLPWLQIGAAYRHDTQPLDAIFPTVETGVFLNPYSSLHFGAYSPVFILNGKVSTAPWLQAGNTAYISKIGLLVRVDIGALKYANTDKYDWNGNIYLREVAFKHFETELQAEHKPYFNTASSVDSTISVDHFMATLGWNDRRTVNGKVGFDFNYFPDQNYVYTAYVWAYAPPIKLSVVELRIGYNYSYSNSKQSRFEPQQSLSQIIANYTEPVTGIYDPYFTPIQMQIHSAIVSLNIKPTKAIELGADASIGFYAYAQNPYLYLNTGDVISTGYSPVNFTPYTLSAFASWHITKKMSLTAQYAYRKTFFYDSNYASLSYRISFENEKKK